MYSKNNVSKNMLNMNDFDLILKKKSLRGRLLLFFGETPYPLGPSLPVSL
jgi:hypothetical protein